MKRNCGKYGTAPYAQRLAQLRIKQGYLKWYYNFMILR